MGDKEETAFIAGTGSGQPTGILVDAEVGATSENQSLLNGDDLMNLVHSLKRAYRKRAVFMMSDDRTGRYFQELRERYAELGQIGYKANQRVDGKLILPEAVQVLQMHAE